MALLHTVAVTGPGSARPATVGEGACCAARNGATFWPVQARAVTDRECAMALTGKFKFRKTLWGKILLQIEEEVKPFWSRSKPGARKRRWRDATLMDLAAPEMRPLIDMRFKPHLWSRTALGLEAGSLHHQPDEAHGRSEAEAPLQSGNVHRIAHWGREPGRRFIRARPGSAPVAQGAGFERQ